MSHIVSASNQGTLGVHPASVEVTARNSETVDTINVGDLVRFDTAQASSIPGQGTADNNSPSNSKFANVKRNILVLNESFGIYGVAQQQILPGKTGKIMVVGVTRVNCVAGNYLAGQTVGLVSAVGLAKVSNSSPVIGFGTVLTPGTNITNVEVMFDGSFGMTTRNRMFNDGPKVYGSTRAGQFIRDAQSGVNSLDVVVIGDSNAGFPGDNGYTVAWNRVMQFGLRVPVYATPLMSGGPSNQSQLTTGNSRGDGLWCLGNSQSWNAQSEAGGSNTGTTFKNMIQSTDTEIVGLRTWLGFNFTNHNVNDTTNKSLFPMGWMSNPAVVEVGQRFTSSFNNYLAVSNQVVSGVNAFGSELGFGTAGTGGHALQYRIVHGTFPTAGSFKPYAFYLGTTGALLRDSSTTSTGGGYGYKTKAFDVTSFTLAAVGSQPNRVCFTWDGANSATNADQANGPFACLWQSVIRPNFKGYAVNCLNYFGGLTTTQVAEKIEDCDKMLDAYLKELRERQVGTTPGTAGTGRVLVFLNSGINGTETTSTWPLAAQRIIDRFRARWVATGGSLENLAFVFTVTHPTADAGVTWTANRAAVAAAANAYAVDNGSTYDLAVVDIGQMLTGLVMSRYSMYDSGGQAHLTKVAIPPAAVTTATDGYETITSAIVSALISST